MNNNPYKNLDLLRELKIREQQYLKEFEALRFLIETYEKELKESKPKKGGYRKIEHKNLNHRIQRRKLGFTQIQLARLAGVGGCTVGTFEKTGNVREENKEKILAILYKDE